MSIERPTSSNNVPSKVSNTPHVTLSDDRLTGEQMDEIQHYHVQLSQLKNELRKRLLSNPNPANRTAEKIEQFVEWARGKGINDDNVQLAPSSLGGLGLFARKSFKEDDLLLEIPSSVMLTATRALQNRRLSAFFDDPLIGSSATLILIFYLLYHDNNPNSEWRPFIDILPQEYSSILSLPDDDIELFDGSEMLSEIKNIQHMIIAQYRYIKEYINNRNHESLFGDFTLKRFLWAYEAVWTRQNIIPNFEGVPEDQSQICAIIPFWDMANHRQGKPVSDFNLEHKSLVFYSMRDVNVGDEVFNFYGDRSNFHLFTTNGFVDLDTPFIGPIKFTVTIQKDDETSVLQKRLFQKLELKPSKRLWLSLKTDVVPEKSEIFATKRIMVMKKPLLQYYLDNDASVLLNTNVLTPEMIELEKDADRWLQVRCAVLMRKYPKIDINNSHIARLIQDEKLVLRSYAMELAPKDS